ncbi:MAG: SGNH/GDSL hydrolase family protein [Candidatus Hydrogenedentota bacterium]
MKTKLKNSETILFIGDSITDCGRRAEFSPLGNGYVKLFADLLAVREPGKALTIINKGIGGDTVKGLRDRWSDDVLRHKPDWVCIKIGINDLHHTLMNDDPIPPADYEVAYQTILERTAKDLPKCQLLLITPFYISVENDERSFRKQVLELLPKYISVVQRMSRKYKTRLVKSQEIFQKLLKHREADTFCPEPIHPNLTGHLVIAEAVYKALSD